MSIAEMRYETKPRPLDAGPGYRFLAVGELIKTGDEFWTRGEWRPALLVNRVVTATSKHLYRRAAA